MVETRGEIRRAPEQVSVYRSQVGLQGRLLMRPEYLDPTKKIPDPPPPIVQPYELSYKEINNASVFSRKSHWESQVTNGEVSNNFDAQFDAWKRSIVTVFNSEKNRDKLQKLSGVLGRLGIQGNSLHGNFTDQDAAKIYTAYLEIINEDGIEVGQGARFVSDVFSDHRDGAHINYQKLQENLDAIEWFANIFGKKDAEIITQRIDAIGNVLSDGDLKNKAFGKQTNSRGEETSRVNELTEQEIELLNHLKVHGEVRAEGTPEGPPILKYREMIMNRIKNDDNVIVIGGTGSGKTTQVPQMIMDMMGPGEKLYVTQPRQINAKDISEGIAKKRGMEFGKKIGFQHGGEKNFDENETSTLFMTEGILLARLLGNEKLTGVNYVMVDEVHVRSKDTEQVLKYLKKAQALRKRDGDPPLKIIAASATVEKKDIEGYFGIEAIEVEGQSHEVKDYYLENFSNVRDIPLGQKAEEAAKTVDMIHAKGGDGDIIVFVSGQGDINKIAELLGGKNLEHVEIIKYHRGSTEDEKNAAKREPTPGLRRIIIATNFAETGITIPGLKYVVNTGEELEQTVDSASGMEYMRLIEQSQAGVKQRRGRVGRTAPGEVYNLFTEGNFKRRQEYPTPEMQRTDLTDIVLQMKKRERAGDESFKVMSDPLDPARIQFAIETLRRLGALDQDGKLNSIGNRMADLPTDFDKARMIVEAENRGVGQEEIVTIASILDAGIVLSGTPEERIQTISRFKHEGSDFLTYLNMWREFQRNGSQKAWAEINGLNYDVLKRATENREKLLGRLHPPIPKDTLGTANPEDIEQSIVAGLKHRLMKFDPAGRTYRWERDNACTMKLEIDRVSVLKESNPEMIVAGDNSRIDESRPVDQRKVYLNQCQRVKSEWI